jgi:hypothetical protein
MDIGEGAIIHEEAGYSFRCITCGWRRQHDTRLVPGNAETWLFSPSAGLLFHAMHNPAHIMSFDYQAAPGEPVLTEAEYAIGAAYSLGLERGRADGLKEAREALGNRFPL